MSTTKAEPKSAAIKWVPLDRELDKSTGEAIVRSYEAPARLMRIAVNRLSNRLHPEWVLVVGGTIAGRYASAKEAMEAAEKL